MEGKDNNFKIKIQDGKEDELNLREEKYALFEIKTQKEETVYLYCSDVESIKYYYWFNGIFEGTTHISISVIACDTENVTNMESMFYYCSSLKKINFGNNFNTTNVTNMAYMFYKCSNLIKLDLKNFDTTNVEDMGYMFSGCSSLTELDLQNFKTTHVWNMGFMFSGCSNLKNLKFGKDFKTKNVMYMQDMFSGCSSLKELDLKNFNTTKVWNNMRKMFYNCNNLTDLKFGDNFNITKVTDMDNNVKSEFKVGSGFKVLVPIVSKLLF